MSHSSTWQGSLSFEQQPEVLALSGLVTLPLETWAWAVAQEAAPGLGLPRAGVMRTGHPSGVFGLSAS